MGSIILFLYRLGTNLISKYFIFLLFGLFFGVYFISLAPSSTPDDNWFIFICGIVAISAMLLPGVSGSFVLLMMKKYAYILNAIGHIELYIIVPFIFGVITGLIVFSRLISYILKYFYQQTILFMTGLLIASLYVIWPFQNRFYEIIQNKEIMTSSRPQIPELLSEQVFYSITMMIFGLLIVIILSRFSRESVTI